ncbi:MAG: Tm-1-like ATP-binding domain-containing protein [Verrucomicrobiales bacterium]|nr:Tm-1-like ATP-binding domain-containing protein [Verrucomicrobiales bacterium]
MSTFKKIAASASENTTTAATELEAAGFQVQSFTDTTAMEHVIASGTIAGVLDLNLADIARAIINNHTTPQLQAAAQQSLPAVIAPGGVDLIHPDENAPPARTTPDQNIAIATLIAENLNRYPIPPTVALPLLGLSSQSTPGTPHHNPEADQALFSTLRQRLNPDITLIESDHAINHPTFALLCARNLLDDLNA